MEKVSFGFSDVSPQEKTNLVGNVFRRVASRYDLMNDAMSGGLHRLWKDDFVRLVQPKSGEHILDMAGGTGDIAFRLAKCGANVTIADINPAMLEVGQKKAAARSIKNLTWKEENAEALSFNDNIFDAYTISFGIRNVTHIQKALDEVWRVLKVGGRFFCMEFSQTRWPGFSDLYKIYSTHIVPKIGQLLANDEESYRYLIESIERFPNIEKFSDMIRSAGFVQVRARPILGGLVVIHSGWKV